MRAGRPLGRSCRARLVHYLVAGAAALLLAVALPAVAAATDYCVAPNDSCGGVNKQKLEDALDAADDSNDADRIFLGAHEYTAPTASGYNYSQAYPLEIIGAGMRQTTLTGPPAASKVLAFYGGPGSSIHDLTIRLPQNAADFAAGLETESTARRIEVVEHPSQANRRIGVDLAESGGTLEDSLVTLPNTPHDSWAVVLGDSGTAVRRSTLSAWTAVRSLGGSIEHSRLIASSAGVAAQRGVTTLEHSLVHMTEGESVGIYASAALGSHATLNADGVTIVGPGLPLTDGAGAFTNFAPAESVDVNLTNSIIRGVERSLVAQTAGPGQAAIAVSYSDYDPSGDVKSGTAKISEANVSNLGDARFVDAAGGDYHLLPGSPLVDAGDPAAAPGLDLDGHSLNADGNGDGTARRDLGAFELQPAAGGGGGGEGTGQQGNTPASDAVGPLVSGFRATPSLFAVARASTPLAARVARGTRFRYALSEPARVTLKIQRILPARRARYRTLGTLKRSGAKGANRIRFSGRIGSRALRRGRYRGVIRAVDAAGNRSAARTARFRVAGS